MVALVLLSLAAQAAAVTIPDAAPATRPPQVRRICRQSPGSEQIVCREVRQQQLGYRLPGYGPAAPQANSANGVRLRAQVSNRGRTGRNRSMATVGIPF